MLGTDPRNTEETMNGVGVGVKFQPGGVLWRRHRMACSGAVRPQCCVGGRERGKVIVQRL